jgi:hypothetical protein
MSAVLTTALCLHAECTALLMCCTDVLHITNNRSEDLQEVVDAAVFEPATWQSPDMARTPKPTTVPAPTRDHLATPCGLLFNELLRSPTVLLDSLDKARNTCGSITLLLSNRVCVQHVFKYVAFDCY